ncbi:gamma-glutamylcyclotransferase [Phaeospirillum tilakii]|uniref:Gamma-glutamylcyclotransferase n=1 Tax=Phaeospirillum tilakii TaxID=741673 RepID=A0ABW5C4G2_9PROT
MSGDDDTLPAESGEDLPPLLYFLCGLDLHPEVIAQRCRNPRYFGLATLPDHALAFRGYSKRWDGAEATVVEAPGQTLFGALYWLDAEDSERIDLWLGVRFNGTGSAFHFPVEVIDQDGVMQEALMHKPDSLGPPGLPSREYLALLIAGAEARGLPAPEIARLRATASKPAAYPVPRRNLLDEIDLAGALPCSACANFISQDEEMDQDTGEGF